MVNPVLDDGQTAHSQTRPLAWATRQAMSLIELLVVMGIIALLTSMALPLLQVARRSADRTNTQSLLRRVDAATKLFRNEVGGLPYQDWVSPPHSQLDPLDASDASLTPPGNRLAFALAHDLTDTEHSQLNADVDKAGKCYQYEFNETTQVFDYGSAYIPRNDYNQPATANASTSYTTLPTVADEIPAFRNRQDLLVRHLNRMAREWARVNVMCGNTGLKKTVPNGANRWEESATLLLPAPASRGWACDYLDLNGDLRRRHVVDDALVDHWRKPLVYVCPVLPGAVGYYPGGADSGDKVGASKIEPQWFGFGPRSRRDATTALASDLRTTASARFEYQAEIWSEGRDGQFSSWRSDSRNRDNISADDYLKGLQ